MEQGNKNIEGEQRGKELNVRGGCEIIVGDGGEQRVGRDDEAGLEP